MRRLALAAMVALSALAGPASLAAEPASPQPATPPPAAAYAMPDTEVFDLTARDEGGGGDGGGGGGQVYRIFVSRPSAPAPAGGYPVLYVLDANALFAGFAGERRLEEFGKVAGGGVMVVGIGYPTDQVYDMQRRLYDLTPPWPAHMPPAQAAMAGLKAGGNENFARFLLGQLRGEIAGRYPVSKERQSLFGHSLGGLFALHMLYTRPTAFEAIVAASPSQWWNDQSLLTEERAFAERLQAGRIDGPVSRVLVVAGERDTMGAIAVDADALSRRFDALSAYGLRTRHAQFDAEEHVTVPTRAITPSLRFVAGAF
ncbi:alpha/beta hydrolase [Novosphingobium resinovorum]|uniref:alpha/beta hydrolase n=1 Tax=Novosphingobium resinovorum TaxID=158500 RepID=UPI002ED104BB|nr:alpha/beta hydrolase-fold protein [Novosphingobium resinovorum]